MSRIPKDTGDRGYYMQGYEDGRASRNSHMADAALHTINPLIESTPNQMKLLRMDVINHTTLISKEIEIIKKYIKGIKDVLRLILKKRPDQTTKNRLKQIIDLLQEEQ